jgi:hypothetical protein
MLLDLYGNFKMSNLGPVLSVKYTDAFESKEVKNFIADINRTSRARGMKLKALENGLGDGVVCTKGMSRDTVFAMYYGEYRRGDSERNPVNEDYVLEIIGKSRDYPNGLEIDGYGTKREPCNLAYVNHSCRRFNAKVEKRTIEGVIILIAISRRDIKPGEQMLINYNGDMGMEGYWQKKSKLIGKHKATPDGKKIQQCLCEYPDECPYKFARFVYASVPKADQPLTVPLPAATSVKMAYASVISHPSTGPAVGQSSHSSIDTNDPGPPLKRKRESASKAENSWSVLVPRRAKKPTSGNKESDRDQVSALPIIVASVESRGDDSKIESGLESERGESNNHCELAPRRIRNTKTQLDCNSDTAMVTKYAMERYKSQTEFTERFHDIELPWLGVDKHKFPRTGNLSKLLWMRLYTLAQSGVVEIDAVEGGLYGISSIKVRKENLDEFNDSHFPCVSTIKFQIMHFDAGSSEHEFLSKEYKRVSDAWKMSGFIESEGETAVEFTYNDDTRLSFQRRNKSYKDRQRKPIAHCHATRGDEIPDFSALVDSMSLLVDLSRISAVESEPSNLVERSASISEVGSDFRLTANPAAVSDSISDHSNPEAESETLSSVASAKTAAISTANPVDVSAHETSNETTQVIEPDFESETTAMPRQPESVSSVVTTTVIKTKTVTTTVTNTESTTVSKTTSKKTVTKTVTKSSKIGSPDPVDPSYSEESANSKESANPANPANSTAAYTRSNVVPRHSGMQDGAFIDLSVGPVMDQSSNSGVTVCRMQQATSSLPPFAAFYVPGHGYQSAPVAGVSYIPFTVPNPTQLSQHTQHHHLIPGQPIPLPPVVLLHSPPLNTTGSDVSRVETVSNYSVGSAGFHTETYETKSNPGSHWKAKMEQGITPFSKAFMKNLSDDMENKQEIFTKRFPDIPLPWTTAEFRNLSSIKYTSKILWMRLYTLIADGIIESVIGSGGFGGISTFVVQSNKLAEFNDGPFPSLSYLRKKRMDADVGSKEREDIFREYKRIHRIWGNVGFVEIDNGKILTFTYSDQTLAKFKGFFKRKKKVVDETDDVTDQMGDGGCPT